MQQFYFGSTKSNLAIGKKIVESIYESIPDDPFELDANQLLSTYGTIPWLKDDIDQLEWNPETKPIDFRKLSTPDTTFCLVMVYDSANPENGPINALTSIVEIFSEFSDHVEQYFNTDATAEVFLRKLSEGIQYHNFYFYEFSHGANYYISLKGGVTRDQFWNAIKDAKNRFIGIFDSCDSGSMLNPSDQKIASKVKLLSSSHVEKKESFIEYIARKFAEKKMAQARLFQASNNDQEPMFQLWSATEESHYGWYYPKNTTIFAMAMKSANKTYKDARLSTMWSKVKALGSYNSHLAADNINKAIPQRISYGDSFDENITWI